MNLHKSCYVYLAKITPYHGKNVFSFFYSLVLRAVVCLVFPLCFPIWQLPLCVSFQIRNRVEKEDFPWGYGGQWEHPSSAFYLQVGEQFTP